MIVSTLISLALLIYVVNHKPITLDFGGWKAPLYSIPWRFTKLTHGYSIVICCDANYGLWIWSR